MKLFRDNQSWCFAFFYNIAIAGICHGRWTKSLGDKQAPKDFIHGEYMKKHSKAISSIQYKQTLRLLTEQRLFKLRVGREEALVKDYSNFCEVMIILYPQNKHLYSHN